MCNSTSHPPELRPPRNPTLNGANKEAPGRDTPEGGAFPVTDKAAQPVRRKIPTGPKRRSANEISFLRLPALTERTDGQSARRGRVWGCVREWRLFGDEEKPFSSI